MAKSHSRMEFLVKGQIRGGKNNMGITSKGIRYPKPEFVEWRNKVMPQLLSQWQEQGKTKVEVPSSVRCEYQAGDRRTRDVPGMEDAIFHCLERSGIVANDGLLEDVSWKKVGYSPEYPYVRLTIEPKGGQ